MLKKLLAIMCVILGGMTFCPSADAQVKPETKATDATTYHDIEFVLPKGWSMAQYSEDMSSIIEKEVFYICKTENQNKKDAKVSSITLFSIKDTGNHVAGLLMDNRDEINAIANEIVAGDLIFGSKKTIKYLDDIVKITKVKFKEKDAVSLKYKDAPNMQGIVVHHKTRSYIFIFKSVDDIEPMEHPTFVKILNALKFK